MLIFPNIQNSFGHGLGTETMPPVMIDDVESTLQVASTTSPDTGVRQITISLFETESSDAISNVSFEVVLIKNDQQLFKNNFERDDGILIMNLVPSDDSNVEIINQETIASFLGLASDQFNLKGNVFENGGLYKFTVKILTVNNYDSLLSEPVEYELGISIPETTYYEINDRNFGKQELGMITYFDQLTEFNYDQTNKQIKFSFPFDWDQKTIDQTTVIHEEVVIPKTFGDLLASSFTSSLNGIALPEAAINIDDFSGEKRTIHLVVTQSELQEIFSKNNFEADEVIIKIKPAKDDHTLSGVTENGQFKIKLWWEDEIRSNANVRLGFDVLDTFLKDRPISVVYELSLFSDQREILKKSGISTGLKTQSDGLEFFIPEDVSGILIVKFENLGGNKLANVEFPLVINRISSESTIPAWIKNNAGWWADGQIPDSTFVQGIQFLIKEGIIIIPPTEQEASSESTIPAWIKNNAGWWADGQIPDSTFVQGIQFLIKEGIIKAR
ncbi:MAG: peptidase [Candidatus Nitrosopelagicus sp.]|nr:peptidase [Candidatus Nitrosopelagicus sp.]